jgi:hypothetical protein
MIGLKLEDFMSMSLEVRATLFGPLLPLTRDGPDSITIAVYRAHV